MGRWIRVDVTRQQHPRAAVAGAWGMIVAEAAWEICKAHDKPGLLPEHYWTAEFLARWTQFDRERGGLTGIKRGMESAVKAGLVEVLPDGSVQMHDWDQHQIDPRSSRKRNRTPRKKARLQGKDPGPPGTAPDHPGSSSATQHGSPPQTPPITDQDTPDACVPDDEMPRQPVSVDPRTIHSQPLDWKIWGAYVRRYEEHSKEQGGRGIIPSHSHKNMRDNVQIIRGVLDRLRTSETTQAEYDRLLDDCLDRFFKQTDDFVVEGDWNFGIFASRLSKIVKKIQAESRRAG